MGQDRSLVNEDVVRPVDSDVVNLVLVVAQPQNVVDGAPGRRRTRRSQPSKSISVDEATWSSASEGPGFKSRATDQF